jgi:IPT/TIG domain
MKKIFLFSISLIIIFYSESCKKEETPIQAAAPAITGFTPSIDSAGGQITITGTNFSAVPADNIVKFNNTLATVLSATTTRLVVVVPNALPSTYTISVTVAGQTATASQNFSLVLANQILLEGNWRYVKSVRCDTEYFSVGITQPWPFLPNTGTFVNLDITYDYLKFNSNNSVYSFQSSWGTGQAGRLYQDTAQYNISDNYIILSYPAGVNSKSLSNVTGTISPINYPAYQDTIFVQKLTSGNMVMKRNYHYKHYGWAGTTYVKKESIDSLIKY